MGYYVEITESTVQFKKEKLDQLMETVKSAFKNGKISDGWFDEKEVLNAKTPDKFFEALYFYVSETETSYKIDCLMNEKAHGNELKLYETMAPFADNGYLEYLGEKGERWRYVFKNGHCTIVEPKIIWNEDEAIAQLSGRAKERIYRMVEATYVDIDVRTQLENRELALTEEQIGAIVDRYVENRDYDCNLSYWTNIDNLIDDEVNNPHL